MQFTVHPSTELPEHVEQLREMFTQEWGQIDSFDGFVHGKALPRPLIALDVNGDLLGGLAFSMCKHPSMEGQALWVNALLVVPSQRRNGIGSRLIQEAESTSRELGFKALHVYTNAPGIYQRHGWCVVVASGQYQVLALAL